MDIATIAFFWGIASAASLPGGAVLGLWLKPGRVLNSAMMAFGAGALLFALSVELFSHVPHHVKEHGAIALAASLLGALSGGLLFDLLNQLLNNRGAFLRHLNNARRYVTRLKIIRTRKLLDELSRIQLFREIAPDDIARLVSKVDRMSFKAGTVVFRQNDLANEMYFIISGQAAVLVNHKRQAGKPSGRSKAGGAEPLKEKIAVLQAGETFGEMGILLGEKRTAEVAALTDLQVYKIDKEDFDEITRHSPEIKREVEKVCQQHIDEHALKTNHIKEDSGWRDRVVKRLKEITVTASDSDVAEETRSLTQAGGSAAMAIWLGILIDGIPESLVIGILAKSEAGISLSFIAGVFLANTPEAMFSSVSMRNAGMSVARILMMWLSITVITGAGAWLGATIIPANPEGYLLYMVLAIEAMAGGAMLTMIAETMLPEAFEQGGAIIGLSTLTGFLTALYIKVI